MKDIYKKAIIKIWLAFAFIIPDRLYLLVLYRLIMGYWMDFNNPKTYNEKLQWLKLNNRKAVYTQMVDKYEAKKYVADRIGEAHIIKTLGLWNSVDEIDFDKLPDRFVLKCTHDSGGIVICTDKNKLDINEAREKLRAGLKKNYYYQNREWPYKNVNPRIIGEEYMVDESGYELKDYKWFCFNGVPKALFVASDRTKKDEETKFDFFDENFNHLDLRNGHPNATHEIIKPKGFDEMKRLAAILSEDIPHLRVDFYDINGKIYFGELTFYHWSGMMPFEPKKWDEVFGDWLILPHK